MYKKFFQQITIKQRNKINIFFNYVSYLTAEQHEAGFPWMQASYHLIVTSLISLCWQNENVSKNGNKGYNQTKRFLGFHFFIDLSSIMWTLCSLPYIRYITTRCMPYYILIETKYAWTSLCGVTSYFPSICCFNIFDVKTLKSQG